MSTAQKEKSTIVVHSGDLDKIYSALIIANGALSMGMESTLFFTFWGLERLKKGSLDKGKLSSMNMLGIGPTMVKKKMKKQNVPTLDTLMTDYKELGGKILACEMTMAVMGIKKSDLRQDLIDGYVGVGSYIQEARESKMTLFI